MGTHPIFESDFDCLTEPCSPRRLPARFMTPPGPILPLISRLSFWCKVSLESRVPSTLKVHSLTGLMLLVVSLQRRVARSTSDCPFSTQLPRPPPKSSPMPPSSTSHHPLPPPPSWTQSKPKFPSPSALLRVSHKRIW